MDAPTFDAHLAYKARQIPRAIALATPAGGVSYAQLDADVNRFAAAFTDLGLARREGFVALGFRDPYRQLASLLAFARLGVPTSPAADRRADVCLVDAAEPGAEPSAPRLLVGKAQTDAILAAEAKAPPPLDLDPDATSRIMLSSGTTAEPRRVAYSWRRIDLVLRTMLTTYATGGFQAWIPWTGVDSSMGLAVAIAGWATGGQTVVGVSTDELPEWLEALPPTLMALTPIQLRQLLEALPEGFQPRPQHRLVLAGSLLPPSLAREARLRLTPDLHVIYGTTETSLIAHGHAAHLDTHPGMVGHVPPGTRVALIDETGRPSATAGEVLVGGERVAAGYEDDPGASAERFRDGWFATGDLGRFTPDGLLVLEGRADERMNLGGRKVMPALLENAALAVEGVLDAAAFSVPGQDGIDRPWLAVTAVPAFDRDRLVGHMSRQPDLPQPSFAWTEEIPRNAMGKVDRSRLREAVLSALKP